MNTERFLHFIWQTLSFEFRNLRTSKGDFVQIEKQGIYNVNQGADFLQAKVRINGVLWAGSVEIHTISDDWYKHGHQNDAHYNGVILHVVEKSSGKPIFREDGTEIPEIEIGERILPEMLARYQLLFEGRKQIPCEPLFSQIPDFYVIKSIESAAILRMEQKATAMKLALKQEKHHWEQVIWEFLAAIMGGTVNGEAFRRMAQAIPFTILQKYAASVVSLTAILLGVAGYLKGEMSSLYAESLQQEWHFLRAKYNLKMPESLSFSYLRMRPMVFPETRIAQLAEIIHHFPQIIQLLEIEKMQLFWDMEILFSEEYWKSHYRLGDLGNAKLKGVSQETRILLIINVLIPLSYLYQEAHGNENATDIFENMLSKLPAEENKITKVFSTLGIKAKNALQSQGMIQLKKYFCEPKACLDCAIGYKILNMK